MLKFFITIIGGPTKESFTNWRSIFIWNIPQFKDKEFPLNTKLYAIVEKVYV